MGNMRIKAARMEKNMTQQALAEAAGVSRQTVNALEQEDYNPTIRLCRAICRVLGKSLDELFGEEEEKMCTQEGTGDRYCENCQLILEGDVCPLCGSRRVREPAAEDVCFLIEKDQLFGDMLADVLKQEKIPFLQRGRLGAALAMRTGGLLESQRFFVRYDDLPRARAVTEELFSADAIVDDEENPEQEDGEEEED